MTTSTAAGTSQHVARAVDNDLLQWVGRLGWVAKGIVYVVFGVLAFRIATGSASGEADPRGAVQQVAAEGAGQVLLIGLAAGLALYALWRLACAALPGGWDATDLAKRAGYVGSGLAYGLLCVTAISIVSAGGGGGSGGGQATDSRAQQLTADLLGQPWGRWLVGVAGVAVVAAGVGFAVYGVARKDEEQLAMGRMGERTRQLLAALGPVGWVARAVVTALVGVFLLQAAWSYDPDEAQGFDGALRDVASSGWGWLVAVTGAGLVVYGAYCLLSAPFRVLRAP